MLRVLMIPTLNSGIVFWRFYNFWQAAFRQKNAEFHVLWWQKKMHEVHTWERDIFNPEMMYRLTNEMQDWAVNSDAIVIQMLHGTGFKTDDKGAHDDYVTNTMATFMMFKDMFPNKPIFSEFDDNMLQTPEYNPANPLYDVGSELREIAIKQLQASDGVIVSTPYLKEVYADYNSNIHVIPNCIDFRRWNVHKKKDLPGIRIGWAGGMNHDGDLEMMKRVIPAIRAAHNNVTFVFLHGCPKDIREMDGIEYHCEWAEILNYPRKIADLDFDIGIAPLIDSAFNRSKSNIRWLEYSALGIPTVASNVGHFKESITHGVDGLLSDTEQDFIKSISSLIADKTLRKNIGINARLTVWRKFNSDNIIYDYARIMEDAIKIKQSVPVEVLQ